MDSRAYTQAYVMINELSSELKNKIPPKVIEAIKSKMDKDYHFSISTEEIDSIDILEDTEKILSVIYTDYLASAEEKSVIQQKEKAILLNEEKEKQRRYANLTFPQNIKTKN